MAAQHSTDDYLLVTKCEPLEQSRLFHGIWTVGFESSSFRESDRTASTPISTSEHYELIVPSSLRRMVHGSDSSGDTVYELSFIGRRSRLPLGPGYGTIVLDRVISMHKVSELR
jgi:hypothetical protein